jgi:hypothetical protein
MEGFICRGPLSPDSPLFRGRAAELTQLIRLCQGEVEAYAIVYGGRQTGKTSLLLRLATQLPEAVRTCQVDFQGLPGATTEQVYTYLAHRVVDSLPYLKAASEVPTVETASKLTEFLHQSVSHPETGQMVLLLEELGALPRESREDLAHVLRFIFTNRFDSSYRALTRLMVVLAGGIEMHELAATEVSPLQNVCEPIYLPDLSEKDAIGLVTDVLTGLGVRHMEAETLSQAIYDHVGGHPYLTQRLGKMLGEGLVDGEPITPNDVVESAVEQLLSGDPLLQHLLRGLFEHHLLAASRSLLEDRLRFSRLDDEMAQLELLGLASEVDGYWTVRNQLLARALEDWLAPSSVSEDWIDALEIRLREFIDHQLTVKVGPFYWKKTMPGDVIGYVKDRINDHLARHSYQSWSDFTSGRSRLDFCVISHYEKIFLKNWSYFEEFFGRKSELQRHMSAYSKLRNSVKHNRESSDIEQQLGKAAMTWLDRILDQCE